MEYFNKLVGNTTVMYSAKVTYVHIYTYCDLIGEICFIHYFEVIK